MPADVAGAGLGRNGNGRGEKPNAGMNLMPAFFSGSDTAVAGEGGRAGPTLRGARQASWIAESFHSPPTGRTNVQISVVSVGVSLPEMISPDWRSRITSTLS